MPCYKPLKAYRTATGVVFSELKRFDVLGTIELPCGQCIGCRWERASQWELRVMHEASLYDRNCFVTLTYGEGKLPPNASLEHRDFQLFMKRLRKWAKSEVRFYMAGEYGPATQRPHYHACLFNIDFDDKKPIGKSASGHVFYTSPVLEKLWGLGHVSVQPLVRQTAGYCARYITTKALGENAKSAYTSVDADGVMVFRKPEYSAMSLRPGIGARWFDRYGRAMYPHDFTVADGTRRRIPKYYDRRARRAQFDLEEVELARDLKRRAAHVDNTDDRRAVREAVFTAKVRSHVRGG